MQIKSNRLNNERGIAAPMTAIAMMVLIGMTTVGIETGRLAMTATEVQDAADIAALTGARAMYDGGDAQSTALTVLAKNYINGEKVSQSHLKSLQIGNYDPENGFVPNLAPSNAVRATVTYNVKNLLAGALGMPVSVVTKMATATFQGAAGCKPNLPIVIGECLFDQTCTDDSCQPFLRFAPNPLDNSAWTGYFGGTGTTQIAAYMPSQCSGGGTSVQIKIGDKVNVSNGSDTGLLQDVQCMINNGMSQVTVGVVPCGLNYNQTVPVLGCATFNMVNVRSSGSPKGITMQGLVKIIQTPPGGPNFGSGPVALVG